MTPARHVAIIMDGNGRWATERGLPRSEGHRRGAAAVRETVRAARELGIAALTLFAFSEQNWGRQSDEVMQLMQLLAKFLTDERGELIGNGIRVRAIGEVARLPRFAAEPLAALEAATTAGERMTLCLALSYGAREALTAATRGLVADAAQGRIGPDDVTEQVIAGRLGTGALPPLDLVIRTSGEQRLSNFLLWEAAYAELVFLPVLWPDFRRAHLEGALAEFGRRQRRFGLTKASAAPAPRQWP